ncbi:MAG: hypothetical protein UT28_C0001G0344 [Berkelbacteria bacterium GW2011_GWE1_39_12]|uniref:Uncharacterized protein n=1 Tax=Berkelbacteria bacterium GW2011_GWE1_39_12 TaxID=1618337 RepID=A0A0G4B3Z9_9BACT|nr:MAG: hypothetical protein UT28_C0001G0344 [Berkelbacteria bacterium GW2011_GWE1_39_12]
MKKVFLMLAAIAVVVLICDGVKKFALDQADLGLEMLDA